MSGPQLKQATIPKSRNNPIPDRLTFPTILSLMFFTVCVIPRPIPRIFLEWFCLTGPTR